MRISAIRGKNLASIEGEFEIDFTREPLASAGIFAITGPTGSGKSTILDALCLALFGKSPRQAAAREQGVELSDGESGKISQSDPRSILRKGTSDGYAEADFTGLDGNRFRATWSVRRARNKPSGNLQDFTMELVNLNTGAPFGGRKTETQKEIERLIGLNYDQFTRSVMLAQGDFTAFLKAGRDEKAALLEKLTGTDIYTEISVAIYSKTKEAETVCKVVSDRLQGISRLKEEEKSILQDRELELNRQIEITGRQHELLIKQKEWHTRRENLEEEVNQADAGLKSAENILKENEGRITQLTLTENIQPARAIFDGLDQLQLDISAKKDAIKQYQGTALTLGESVELLKTAEAESLARLNEAEEQLSVARPLLKTAAELDMKMASQTEQLEISRKEADAHEETKKRTEAEEAENRKRLLEAETTISELSGWFEKNRSREPIIDNLSLIINSLGTAAKGKETIIKLGAECTRLQEAVSIQRLQSDEWQKTADAEKQRASELRTILQQFLQKIGDTDSDTIDKRLKEISGNLEILSIAESLWSKKSDTHKILNTLYESRGLLGEKLVSAEEALKIGQEKLSEARIRRDQTRQLLDQARLMTAENVEALRKTLSDNQPCPVCGSTDHPYTDPERHFSEEHKILETEYYKCSKTYDEWVQNEARIRESLSHLTAELTKTDLEIPGIEQLNAELTEAWKRLNLPEKIRTVSEEQMVDVITKMKLELKEETGDLQKVLENLKALNKESESIRQELEKSGTITQKLEKQVSESLHAIELLEKEKKQHEERILELELEYSEITGRVDVWFVQPDWLENWKRNPGQFIVKIQEFVTDWNQKAKNLEDAGVKQKMAESTLTMLAKQNVDVFKNLEAVSTRLEIQQQLLKGLQTDRKALFNGEPVSDVEHRLTEQVKSRRIEHAGIQRQHMESLSERDKNSGILKQLQDDLLLLHEKIAAAEKNLEAWISGFYHQQNLQLSVQMLRDLLARSGEWIATEKKQIRELKDAVIKAASTLQERREQYEKHHREMKEVPEKEMIIREITTIEKQREDLTKELTGITFRLREDENNRIKAGALMEEYEKKQQEMEKWQKLNELLGSADGKKFRQIAQEYTLEVLLGFANIHLGNLSGRYTLSGVPGTLALQVTDHDMGDEVRSVHSLSGGESFLVSLALALGLASLSSGKMNVESLFIDEGFGSLDPLTLNIAMDALEQLHNQGRKVGVISHVQEMTERIQTKIQLKKESGGKSKVLVYSS
jgi:exonuclease SbcC